MGVKLRDRIRDRWRLIRPELLSGLAFNIVRSVGRTLKVEALNFPADDQKVIFCGWHGQSFVFANYFRNRGYWVIISSSRDGDMQNSIFTRLGYKTIRGSTGRGGVRALKEAIRELKSGATMAMTPDGPRGPKGIVQPGIMAMAHKSGCGLIPVGIAAKPCWISTRSWDHYMVPAPFARAVLHAGDPIYVPATATEDEVEAIRLQLEARIHQLQKEAEEYVARPK